MARLETRTEESNQVQVSWGKPQLVSKNNSWYLLCQWLTHQVRMSLSMGTSARTRKMMNYACAEQMQGKP